MMNEHGSHSFSEDKNLLGDVSYDYSFGNPYIPPTLLSDDDTIQCEQHEAQQHTSYKALPRWAKVIRIMVWVFIGLFVSLSTLKAYQKDKADELRSAAWAKQFAETQAAEHQKFLMQK